MSISGFISLDELKDQVVIERDNDTHDAILTRLLGAAEKHTVQFLNIESLDELEESPVQSPRVLPEDITSAILMLAAHLFENREAINVGNIVTQVPFGYESLLWPHRQELGV